MSRVRTMGLWVGLVLAVVGCGSALAGTVSISTDPGSTWVIGSVPTPHVSGGDMLGMLVTAHFTDGSQDSGTWLAGGLPSISADAHAAGTGWALWQSGDTYDWSWHLMNLGPLAIRRLVIDAGPGGVGFDLYDDIEGTAGSEEGKAFHVTCKSQHDLDMQVTYRHAAALVGEAPVGDMYRVLDLLFANDAGFRPGSAANPEWLCFKSDTDAVTRAIPLPPAAWGGMAMLAGLGAVRMVRRKLWA